jgi:general secretion pathway protein I
VTTPRASLGRRHRLGFTLLEVMIGLAVLGLGLTVLIKSAANSIYGSQESHMMGVATDLARAKMYDLEEKLLKDGFSDTTQEEEDQAFADEGWPQIHYSYKIEAVELPSWDQLQALAMGHALGSGSAGSGSAGSGSAGSGYEGAFPDQNNNFSNSTLGGMLTQFGGLGFTGVAGGSGTMGGSGDIAAAGGASFVQSQYSMFQSILKVAIRKVTLTVKWKVLGRDADMKVVAFFTDAASMDKVINGLGSQDLDDASAAKGSGSGSGRGSGSSTGGTGGTTGGTGGGRGAGSSR